MSAVTPSSRSVRQSGTASARESSTRVSPTRNIPLDVRCVRKARREAARVSGQAAVAENASSHPPGPVPYERVRAASQCESNARIGGPSDEGRSDRREGRQRKKGNRRDGESLSQG